VHTRTAGGGPSAAGPRCEALVRAFAEVKALVAHSNAVASAMRTSPRLSSVTNRHPSEAQVVTTGHPVELPDSSCPTDPRTRTPPRSGAHRQRTCPPWEPSSDAQHRAMVVHTPRSVLVGAQQQEQAREAASAGRTACRTALGSRCCGCRRPHPLGSRTPRQNSGRLADGRSAERHVRVRSRTANTLWIGRHEVDSKPVGGIPRSLSKAWMEFRLETQTEEQSSPLPGSRLGRSGAL